MYLNTDCVCIYVPEQSLSPSVLVESHFCLSEQSSSEDSPASPGAPCTYITAKTQTGLTIHLTAVHHQTHQSIPIISTVSTLSN